MSRRHDDGPFDLVTLLAAAREAARLLYGPRAVPSVATTDGRTWAVAVVLSVAAGDTRHLSAVTGTATDAAEALLSSLQGALRERDDAALDAAINDGSPS